MIGHAAMAIPYRIGCVTGVGYKAIHMTILAFWRRFVRHSVDWQYCHFMAELASLNAYKAFASENYYRVRTVIKNVQAFVTMQILLLWQYYNAITVLS